MKKKEKVGGGQVGVRGGGRGKSEKETLKKIKDWGRRGEKGG